jgi:hypothetical protein
LGFGKYHYRYPSGQNGDWFITGFSQRKDTITLYLMAGLNEQEELLKKLG